MIKKPIPKSIENKIRNYVKYQQKANTLDDEIRHWLYKNNYDRALIDLLIDVGQSGDANALINFLNGEENIYGFTIDELYNDNSEINETEYL